MVVTITKGLFQHIKLMEGSSMSLFLVEELADYFKTYQFDVSIRFTRVNGCLVSEVYQVDDDTLAERTMFRVMEESTTGLKVIIFPEVLSKMIDLRMVGDVVTSCYYACLLGKLGSGILMDIKEHRIPQPSDEGDGKLEMIF